MEFKLYGYEFIKCKSIEIMSFASKNFRKCDSSSQFYATQGAPVSKSMFLKRVTLLPGINGG